MGANAQTSVPTFTAGEVLTAANMNISARTGIPVFADSTARDAAFGGTGEKVLAEGQYAYLESTNATQVYDGANWVSVGTNPGLVLVKTQTIGSAVASVTVSDAFSATYDTYKITITGGAGTVEQEFDLALGATNTGYYRFVISGAYSTNTVSGSGAANAANWSRVGIMTANNIDTSIELRSPFETKPTIITAFGAQTGTTGQFNMLNGFLNNSTSYTAFTITPQSGTMTGGTIRVYGYANS